MTESLTIGQDFGVCVWFLNFFSVIFGTFHTSLFHEIYQKTDLNWNCPGLRKGRNLKGEVRTWSQKFLCLKACEPWSTDAAFNTRNVKSCHPGCLHFKDSYLLWVRCVPCGNGGGSLSQVDWIPPCHMSLHSLDKLWSTCQIPVLLEHRHSHLFVCVFWLLWCFGDKDE